MAYSTLSNILVTLERVGIADVILPFILVFTLVFATLQKTKVLGNNKNFNVILGLVLGLSVVIPHAINAYPQGADVVDIINASLPQVALVLIIGLMMMILVGLWGVSPVWKGPLTGIIMLASFGVILWIFAGSSNFISFPRFLDNPETQALIVVILVFGLVVAAITSEPKKSKGEGLLEGIGKFFEKS